MCVSYTVKKQQPGLAVCLQAPELHDNYVLWLIFSFHHMAILCNDGLSLECLWTQPEQIKKRNTHSLKFRRLRVVGYNPVGHYHWQSVTSTDPRPHDRQDIHGRESHFLCDQYNNEFRGSPLRTLAGKVAEKSVTFTGSNAAAAVSRVMSSPRRVLAHSAPLQSQLGSAGMCLLNTGTTTSR